MQIKTVEIFKTNVRNETDTNKAIAFLLSLYQNYKINFDLEDEEKILRVEANQPEIETNKIIHCMVGLGYSCERIE